MNSASFSETPQGGVWCSVVFVVFEILKHHKHHKTLQGYGGWFL